MYVYTISQEHQKNCMAQPVRQPKMTPSPKRGALNGVKHHAGLLWQCAFVADADGDVTLGAGWIYAYTKSVNAPCL